MGERLEIEIPPQFTEPLLQYILQYGINDMVIEKAV